MQNLFHIHQTAELAERVLLPGDPGRALRLAQALLHEPKMLNHNRGLWGYTGVAFADDRLLSIQSTGMGGPSIAIVAAELIELGARRFVRVGSCGGLSGDLNLGQLVVAEEVICCDGTSRALGAGARAVPADGLLDALLAGAPGAAAHGPVVSTDLFYDAEGLFDGWIAAGAIAVEMEAATLLTVAAHRGVDAACVLLVSNLLGEGRGARIGEAELHAAELDVGRLAVAALAELA